MPRVTIASPSCCLCLPEGPARSIKEAVNQVVASVQLYLPSSCSRRSLRASPRSSLLSHSNYDRYSFLFQPTSTTILHRRYVRLHSSRTNAVFFVQKELGYVISMGAVRETKSNAQPISTCSSSYSMARLSFCIRHVLVDSL